MVLAPAKKKPAGKPEKTPKPQEEADGKA
jgi:hypothetical protein